jgi:hypothetical protein
MDSSTETSTAPAPAPQQQIKLSEINVNNEQIALNLMVAFCNAAQSRGAFNMEESAKLWECVKFFSKPVEETATVSDEPTEKSD